MKERGCCNFILNTLTFLAVIFAIWAYAALKAGPHGSPLCSLLKYNCPVFEIEGDAAPGFEKVKDLLKENTMQGVEQSACVVAYVKGNKVVDVCSGRTHDNRPYRDGLQIVYSSTKFVSQVVVATLVDKGYLSFDDKIAKYWPEFAQGNKENVTVADLLQHAAGVAYLDEQLYITDLENLDNLAVALAKQAHNHGGVRTSAYHTVTQGFYLNELVRRVDPKKRTIGQYVREEFNEKLGTEIYIGLNNKTEEGQKEVAKVWPRFSHLFNYPISLMLLKILPATLYSHFVEKKKSVLFDMFNKESFTYKTFTCVKAHTKEESSGDHNAFPMFSFEGAAFNGITNAQSLAKIAAFYAGKGSLNGQTLINQETFEIANTPQTKELDHTFHLNFTRTKGGYGVFEHMGGARGWAGLGGSLVVYDPEREIGFSYVMNAAEVGMIGQRAGVYLREIQRVVDASRKH